MDNGDERNAGRIALGDRYSIQSRLRVQTGRSDQGLFDLDFRYYSSGCKISLLYILKDYLLHDLIAVDVRMYSVGSMYFRKPVVLVLQN